MEEIRDFLHLDVVTVTGRTLGENLDNIKEPVILRNVMNISKYGNYKGRYHKKAQIAYTRSRCCSDFKGQHCYRRRSCKTFGGGSSNVVSYFGCTCIRL